MVVSKWLYIMWVCWIKNHNYRSATIIKHEIWKHTNIIDIITIPQNQKVQKKKKSKGTSLILSMHHFVTKFSHDSSLTFITIAFMTRQNKTTSHKIIQTQKKKKNSMTKIEIKQK